MDGHKFFFLLYAVIFVAMGAIALFLCLPKAVSLFSRWKENRRAIDLSAAATMLAVAFFLMAADFIMFIRFFLQIGGIACIR